MAPSSSSFGAERVYRSCDVSTSFAIDVSGLHGRFAAAGGEKKEVLVEVRILSSTPTNSNSNTREDFTELTTSSSTRTSLYQNGCALFQEKIEFPMKVNDLPSDSVLELSLVDCNRNHLQKSSGTLGEKQLHAGAGTRTRRRNKNKNDEQDSSIIGYARIKLFDEATGKLVEGQKRLPLQLSSSPSSTASGMNTADGVAGNNDDISLSPLEESATEKELIVFTEELERFEEMLSKYERGEVPHVSWLDKMTFSRIQDMRRARLEELEEMSGYVEVHVEFPTYALPIIFSEGLEPKNVRKSRKKNWESLVWLIDEEIAIETQNPSEIMHYELTRTHGREVVDKDLKPNAEEKARLAIAMSSPSTRKMDMDTQNLLWKFRYSLSSDPRALTKFLKSVDWNDKDETKAAIGLMHQWTPIGPADALQLLTPHFKNIDVRSYAVAVLSRAEDDEILIYLLQLVQALRYEPSDDSVLSRFLISRALKNTVLANFFYWFLVVGFENPSFERRAMATHQMFEQACHDLGPEGTQQWIALKRQGVLIERLTSITADILNLRGARKVERLRAILNGQGIGTELTYFTHNIPHLLDPLISLTGINSEESFVFKSALSPLKLAFRDVNDKTQNVIFKRGDDCRQDQLCVQLIQLIDKLWKRENLDLRLTPYRVLAASTEIGLIEFVKSSAIADILKEHDSLRAYIAIHNPDPKGPGGCTMQSLQNFVKSCAGYSVITYLLGVGDRHLDNLMLTKDGKLFHIDFGYMMGRDPKISPPSIKISKEMVDCLGEFMDDYKRYCVEAYNLLRKPHCVTLILNLFELMADSDLPDLRGDAGAKLEAKFAIDLDDEAAGTHFIQEIQRSMNALFDPLFERIHAVAQRMR
jgi:phosphatidylinositol 3-kinase